MKTTFIRGMRGYAAVLRAIYDKPMTAKELCAELGANYETINKALKQFRAAGLAHICGVTSIYRSASHQWTYGPGTDAVVATARTLRPQVEMVTFLAALKTLEQPHTLQNLRQALGISPHPARLLVKRMHELGMVYIDHWVKQPDGPPVAAYRLGWDRRDATRPKRKPPCEVWRAYDERRRAKQREAQPFDVLAANFFSMQEAA